MRIMTRNHRKQKAWENPKSAADWAEAALYPESPYNQFLLISFQRFIDAAEVLKEMELIAELVNSNEAAKRKAFIERAIDREAAKQLVSSHLLYSRENFLSPHSARKESIFELEAKKNLLQQHLDEVKAKLPDYDLRIKEAVAERKETFQQVDDRWKVRQRGDAESFATSVNERLAKNNADFKVKMLPSIVKKLEKAFISASPAKILTVNPDLAKKPELNAKIMENMGNFVRELNVLSEINRLKSDIENKLTELEVFPKPSELKQLVKFIQVPRLTHDDRRDIVTTLGAVKAVNVAKKDLRMALKDIHLTEKALIRTKDEILALRGQNHHQPHPL